MCPGLLSKTLDCKQLDIDNFLDHNGDITDCFTCVSVNTRSLINKLQDIEDFITDLNSRKLDISIFAFQEIWSIPKNLTISIDNYNALHFASRDSMGTNLNCGGGVAILVHNKFRYEPIKNISIFEPRFFESQFIKVYLSEHKYIIIGNIYRPPTGPLADLKKFVDKLEEILYIINTDSELKMNDDVVLLGDFNIDLIKYNKNYETSRYLDVLFNKGLTPGITLPTRVTNKSSTLIDHISFKNTDNYVCSGVFNFSIADHLPTFFMRKLGESKEKLDSPIWFRDMSRKNTEKVLDIIRKKDWSSIVQENRPKYAFDKYFTELQIIIEQNFPLKLKKPTSNNKKEKPWMTNELLSLRKKKHKLAAKKMKYPTLENIDEFKALSNKLNCMKRKAKNLYYKNKLSSYHQNAKKIWDTLREVLGEQKKINTTPDFFWEGKTKVSGDSNIAEGFSNFFAEIGDTLARKIPKSNKNFKNYLGNKIEENFVFKSITPTDLFEVAKTLKPKSSFGADFISLKLLKDALPDLAKPICHLFNLSIHTGYIPPEFKIARVIPIYKSDSRHSYNNYRPISLLSSLSKLLEKIVAKQMMGYINKNSILYDLQFGFRKGHNTTQPVLHFLDKIQTALNKDIPEYTAAVFLDLKKAFDTANHSILLKKMEHYGFRGLALDWFTNYLSNRKIFVSINGMDSSPKSLDVGVPQGSVLGPLLFLLLINDLPLATPTLKVLLFADDTTFQLSGKNIDELFSCLNEELTRASEWFKCNKLTLNISKTKYMIFRAKNMPLDNSISLKIGNETLERYGEDCNTKSFKFVGIQLDEFFTWKHHISVIRKKIACANFKINQCKNFISTKPRLMLYNSMIKPHYEYGCMIWGGASEKELRGLIVLQKKCIRNICNERKFAHTNLLFHRLSVLKFKDLFTLNCSIFMYKQFYGLHGTGSFENVFVKLFSNRSMQFKVKLHKRSLKSLPTYYLVQIWNEIKVDLKNKQSVTSFKNSIFNLLLDQYMTI